MQQIRICAEISCDYRDVKGFKGKPLYIVVGICYNADAIAEDYGRSASDLRKMELHVKNGVGIAEALIFAVAFAAAALLLGEEGLSERRRLMAQKTKLSMEHHNLTLEIKQLERRARLLRGDAGSVERAAKARLGMARPDETVYVFSGVGLAAPRVSGSEPSLENHDNTP